MSSFQRFRGQLFFAFIFVLAVSLVASSPMEVNRGRQNVVEYLVKKNSDVEGFLKKYGYMEEKPVALDKSLSSLNDDEELKRAIRRFQEFYGLPVTGEVDELTKEKMAMPRCGVKDIEGNTAGRNKRFTRLGRKWENPNLTWQLKKLTYQLPESKQRELFRRAFKLWQDVSPLSIRETSKNPDIEISFHVREHGDNNPFDGKGNVLAHAFGPGLSPISGDVHFDNEEVWTVNGHRGSNLLVAAAHEFGHALGLGHTGDRKALMFPAYQNQEVPHLGYDDIRGIQYLYGSKIKPTSKTTTEKPEDTCTVKFDDVVNADDGYFYGFKGSEVYKINEQGVVSGYPKPIADVFPEAPSNVDVAFAKHGTSRIYFIKDFKVWRYTNFKLDENYPFDVPRRNFMEKPRFVINYRDDRRVFLFGSRYWWEYDLDDKRTYRTYRTSVESIDRFWQGIPSDARYAVRHTQDNFYLVSNSSFLLMSYLQRKPVNRLTQQELPVWLCVPCNSAGNASALLTMSLITFLVSYILSNQWT